MKWTPAKAVRDLRQQIVNNWVATAFGKRFLVRRNRAERVLEEALELAQASDYPEHLAAALVAKVYARPKGEIHQEIGGLSVCLLSFCQVEGLSADDCEVLEIERVLSKPVDHFRRKLKDKLAAGICTDEAA